MATVLVTVLVTGLGACSDAGILGVDDPEEGILLRTDRTVYQLEESGELTLTNGYRGTVYHGTICTAEVQRRVEGSWRSRGWLGHICQLPLLRLEPGETFTRPFVVRGSPIPTSSGAVPGPFRFGGHHRLCLSIEVGGHGSARTLDICSDPFYVELPEWTPPLTSLAVGGEHVCAVTAAGGAFCWGGGRYGQLGDGTSDAFHQEERPVPVAGDLHFASVTAGRHHTCGVVEGGEAWCWGRAHAGQLGNGLAESSAVPVPVAGGYRFSRLTAGEDHTCGITTDAEALCWGQGASGRLGSGSASSSATPVAVAGGHRFSALSAGSTHTCGVTEQGEAWCWGFNGEGQLGTDAVGASTTPTRVEGDLVFARVAAGEAHTCGLGADGEAYCWGRNTAGQLGDGSTSNHSRPVPVSGGRPFRALGAGASHSCGVDPDGVLYCWGLNELGQLGSGSWGIGATEVQPVPAFGGHPFAAVDGGESHTCALRASGAPYCWGLNARGQLGIGSRTSSNRPTAVKQPSEDGRAGSTP